MEVSKVPGNKSVEELQKEWDALSGDEKVARLEPRIVLMISLLRQSYDILKQKNLMFDDLENGMKILNLKT